MLTQTVFIIFGLSVVFFEFGIRYAHKRAVSNGVADVTKPMVAFVALRLVGIVLLMIAVPVASHLDAKFGI